MMKKLPPIRNIEMKICLGIVLREKRTLFRPSLAYSVCKSIADKIRRRIKRPRKNRKDHE